MFTNDHNIKTPVIRNNNIRTKIVLKLDPVRTTTCITQKHDSKITEREITMSNLMQSAAWCVFLVGDA